MSSPKSPYKDFDLNPLARPRKEKGYKIPKIFSATSAELRRKKNYKRCSDCLGGRTTRKNIHGYVDSVICVKCSGTGRRPPR